MKLFLLIFSNGEKFKIAGERLKNQALNLNIFHEIIYINEDNKPDYFVKFLLDNETFISQNPRGYGYWLWKPFLVKWQLDNQLAENDILIYLDSGCELSEFGLELLNTYIKFTTEEGALFFTTGFKESNWTKKDLLLRLNCLDYKSKNQIQATFFFIRNTSRERDLVNKWFELSIEDNYHFLDDSPSINQNDSKFIEHRHDQSILSLLAHSGGYRIINMSCLFNSKFYYANSYILKYPIHAARNFSHISVFNCISKKSQSKNIVSNKQKLRYYVLKIYLELKLLILALCKALIKIYIWM